MFSEEQDIEITDQDIETVRSTWDARVTHDVCPTENEVYEALQQYPLATIMQSLSNLGKRMQRERGAYLPDELVLQMWPEELERQFFKDKDSVGVWRAR